MKKIVYLLLVCILLFACEQDEIRVQSIAPEIADDIIERLSQIKDAYLKKDKPGIKKLLTNECYKKNFGKWKDFDSAELTFTPKWVEIRDKTTVHIHASWTGKWRHGEMLTNERGLGIFVFKGRPAKLDQILRANPFIYPE